jgi:hypothetical protein
MQFRKDEVENASNCHLLLAFKVNTGSLLHVLTHKIEFDVTKASTVLC